MTMSCKFHKNKHFTLHWLDGKIEYASGNSIEDAARKNDIGGGALRAKTR